MPRAELRNLSVLAYAQGFTHWLYNGEPEDVVKHGFFPTSETMFANGDLMTVRGSAKTALFEIRFTADGSELSIRSMVP